MRTAQPSESIPGLRPENGRVGIASFRGLVCFRPLPAEYTIAVHRATPAPVGSRKGEEHRFPRRVSSHLAVGARDDILRT